MTMDDKDQTQIRPLDSPGKPARSRTGSKQPVDQPVPDHAVSQVVTSPLVSSSTSPAHPAETAQSLPSSGVLPINKLQPEPPTQKRQSRQPARPPVVPPQPILFAERESDGLTTEPPWPAAGQRWRFPRTRRWLRSRTGRVVLPLVMLLLGIAIGLTSLIWYGLSGEGPLTAARSNLKGNLIVEANKDFVTQLITTNLKSAGLPGNVQNVTVELVHGAKIIIQGDDVYPTPFMSVTRHFTVNVQPYVQNCLLQVRITHADLAGIPVTTFVQTFEGQINQQLAKKPASLPTDFAYCVVGVNTEPVGMYITYLVVPVTKK